LAKIYKNLALTILWFQNLFELKTGIDSESRQRDIVNGQRGGEDYSATTDRDRDHIILVQI